LGAEEFLDLDVTMKFVDCYETYGFQIYSVPNGTECSNYVYGISLVASANLFGVNHIPVRFLGFIFLAMHYLITGHTGFKGSWLAAMLSKEGHTVSGIALAPTGKALYSEAHLVDLFSHDQFVDIRNRVELESAIKTIAPDVVIHLAAQPLVRESYKTPVEPFETNVLGTLNVLEALKNNHHPDAALVITTDKVYKNKNLLTGYPETSELGGDDPYSASKAAADIAAQSWVKSFNSFPVAIARAGNVIGGGDWAADRLLPDLVTAFSNNESPVLRYPKAIRPWQHVLDCLNGYLKLVDAMLQTGKGGEWNFGPKIEVDKTVGVVADTAARYWGNGANWVLGSTNNPHEAGYLLLDSSKARHELKWEDKLSFVQALEWSIEFYKSALGGVAARELLENQIDKYLAI
jgi:CDP-glucose 4,6-dehydratase